MVHERIERSVAWKTNHEAFIFFSGSQHRAIQHTHAYGVTEQRQLFSREEDSYFGQKGLQHPGWRDTFDLFEHAHSGNHAYMRALSVSANAK